MNYLKSIDHRRTLPDSNARNNKAARSWGLFMFSMLESWCGDRLVAFQSCDVSLTDVQQKRERQPALGANDDQMIIFLIGIT